MKDILNYKNQLLNLQLELNKIEDQLQSTPLNQFILFSFLNNSQICEIFNYEDNNKIHLKIHGAQSIPLNQFCIIDIKNISFIKEYLEEDFSSTHNFNFKSQELISYESNLTFIKLL